MAQVVLLPDRVVPGVAHEHRHLAGAERVLGAEHDRDAEPAEAVVVIRPDRVGPPASRPAGQRVRLEAELARRPRCTRSPGLAAQLPAPVERLGGRADRHAGQAATSATSRLGTRLASASSGVDVIGLPPPRTEQPLAYVSDGNRENLVPWTWARIRAYSAGPVACRTCRRGSKSASQHEPDRAFTEPGRRRQPRVAPAALDRARCARPGRAGPGRTRRQRAVRGCGPWPLDDAGDSIRAGQLGARQRGQRRDVRRPARHAPRRVERGNLTTCGPRSGTSPDGELPRPGLHGLRRLQEARGRRLGAARREPVRRAAASSQPRSPRSLAAAQQPDGYLTPTSRSAAASGTASWPGATRCTAPGTCSRPPSRRTRGTGDAAAARRRRRAWPTTWCATFGAAGEQDLDGHPVIETALVELYRETGSRAYLDLARALRRPARPGPDRGLRHGPPLLLTTTCRCARRPRSRGTRSARCTSARVPPTCRRDRRRRAAGRAARRSLATWWPTKTYLTGGIGSRATTRPSATPTSCPRTAPTPRPAPPSAASSGPGGCCSPPATRVRRRHGTRALQRLPRRRRH